MIKSKFAISIHILSLLENNGGEWLSSEIIAGSLNANPALVRKEICNLRSFELVESKEGKNGGTRLAKPAKDILLSDVFHAIKDEHVFGYSPNEPNHDCAVGKKINESLDQLFGLIDERIFDLLQDISLEEFCKNFSKDDCPNSKQTA
ncbi:transcriptional regulator [Chitinophaga caeni]|uniref:Transcriptional regulator n=1 Tax=Chitinophaga caeni TaxID=2029983 RepID=A0A291R133_9BACT|nr:Rrf2 family transcriptional regulator [Chitinophaga caeni]ATL49979.1 transcriptional regulator [Chitinophaga caeni]